MANSNLIMAGYGGVDVAYVAPLGTTLPADATTALAGSYLTVGYISQDGVSFSRDMSTNPINAYGTLSPVLTLESGSTYTAQITMLESNNATVRAVYHKLPLTGSGAITVATTSSAGTYAIAEGAPLTTRYVFVSHIIFGSNIVRRVLPNCEVTAQGDEVFNGQDAASLQVTLTAYPDNSGNSFYTYSSVAALHT